MGTESGSELSFDLVRDTKESADELAEASPETRVCLHAKRYANRKYQETCFQFVHDLPLLYAVGVPCMRYMPHVAYYQTVTQNKPFSESYWIPVQHTHKWDPNSTCGTRSQIGPLRTAEHKFSPSNVQSRSQTLSLTSRL